MGMCACVKKIKNKGYKNEQEDFRSFTARATKGNIG